MTTYPESSTPSSLGVRYQVRSQLYLSTESSGLFLFDLFISALHYAAAMAITSQQAEVITL